METTVGPKKSWRLVHDGKNVLAFMETAGFTTTMHTMFESQTEQECLDEIVRLGLVMLESKETIPV